LKLEYFSIAPDSLNFSRSNAIVEVRNAPQ